MKEALKNAATKSWVTTLIGVAGALGLVLGGLHAQFDADPVTVADWIAIVPEALAMIGIGAAARDHGVTSEQAGAKTERGIR